MPWGSPVNAWFFRLALSAAVDLNEPSGDMCVSLQLYAYP